MYLEKVLTPLMSPGRMPHGVGKGPLALTLAVGALAASAFLPGTHSAHAQTLTDALAITYEGNPTLLAARAQLRATDENVAQAVSNWRPSLVGNGIVQYNHVQNDFSPSLGAGFGSLTSSTDDRTSKGGGVTLQQNVYRGGQTQAATRQAKSEVAAGRSQLTGVEQQVLFDAVTAYMDVLRDTATLELNRNNAVVLERQLQATRDRFEVGEITRTDVAQAIARLSRAQSDVIGAEAELTNSRAAYERVVGTPPGTLEVPPEFPPLPATEEEALTIALANNPSLEAARFSEEATRHAVREAKGALLPTVTVEGEYNYIDNPSPSFTSTERATVTGQLIVPLYQSGAVFSQVRQAKQLNSQSRVQIREAMREVTEGVAASWEGFRASNAQVVSDREQVRANEVAREGVFQEAQVGSRTTLDVLDADQELLDSQVALVTSRRNAYVAAYALLGAIGNLTAEFLELPVEQYNPEQNYDSVSDKWFGFGISDEPDTVAPESGTDAAGQL